MERGWLAVSFRPMTTTTFPPPAVEADQVLPQLRERGYAVLNAATVSQWAACALPDLQGFGRRQMKLTPAERE